MYIKLMDFYVYESVKYLSFYCSAISNCRVDDCNTVETDNSKWFD